MQPFTLSRRVSEDSELGHAGRRNHERRPWTPVHVVVAEDDDDMRNLIVRALREEGFKVDAVRSGWELLNYLGARIVDGRAEPPLDLIISDVRMHGITGLSVLAGLRDTQWMTPFILITAFGDAKLHGEARRLGALAVFDKPFALGDLRRLARETTQC